MNRSSLALEDVRPLLLFEVNGWALQSCEVFIYGLLDVGHVLGMADAVAGGVLGVSFALLCEAAGA